MDNKITFDMPSSCQLNKDTTENPSDLAKLDDPLAFFSLHNEDLVCLDEIQRAPGLFSILRSIIDERARNGQFLILGSAGLI